MFANPLSLVIWTPIVAGLLVLATGGDQRAPLARWLALAGAVLGFLVSFRLQEIPLVSRQVPRGE